MPGRLAGPPSPWSRLQRWPLPALAVALRSARGPELIADVAEQVIDAVVNISTSQNVEATRNNASRRCRTTIRSSTSCSATSSTGAAAGRQSEPRARAAAGQFARLRLHHRCRPASWSPTTTSSPTPTRSPSSSTTASRLKAELIGKDQKTDIALLRIKTDKPLKAVKFGDSDKLRLGEWVIAIGNPFSLGGTVTAGIVSARNRDINSGPYDNYIQTDAAINRGNSGGPLFNLEGEVIGINTAIISPSGGSIGIGFAVPSKTALTVIDQLKQFGETRRGWLGVRIQQVTDEIAESLGIKPARGALVAGVDEQGPGQARRHRARRRDRPVRRQGHPGDARPAARRRRYAGRQGSRRCVIIRKGKEETKTVKLGRLEDGEKQRRRRPSQDSRRRTSRW